MIGMIYLTRDHALWDGEQPRALARLGGLPLVERQVRTLQRSGCQRVLVMGANTLPQVEAYLASCPASEMVEYLTIASSDARLPKALDHLKADSETPVLILMDDCICSVEFLRHLVRRKPGTFAVVPSGNRPQVAAAFLDGRQLFAVAEHNVDKLAQGKVLSVLREFEFREVTVASGTGGEQTPLPGYCFPVKTREDLRRGLNVLIESTQKGFGDFMGEYLHRVPENWLVRRLVDTPVTPNQVSILNILIGLVAVGLFATGWFRAGVVLILPLGILDGVDGKLARVRMAESRLGAFLDGILTDKVLQTLWVAAIAAHALWGLGRTEALPLFVAFLCGDNLTRILSSWYNRRFETEQLERIPRFRKVRAGRNTYVFILAVSALAGASLVALWGVAIWSVCSFAFRAGHAWIRTRHAPATGSLSVGTYAEPKGK